MRLLILTTIPVLLCAQQSPDPVPQPVKTSITVVESIATETPANVSVMTPSDLAESPGVNLDDRLRQVPGFTLFRRTSSLVAHPTTQGISLRGIGSSGASRTLVLWDGIPMNDPFGAWVYWTRFPVDELERVEISRGASTSVFGNLAMSGALGLFSTAPKQRRLNARYSAGNRDSHDASLGYSNTWSGWGLSAYGRGFTTEGYYIVPESVRGSADRRASLRFVSTGGAIDRYTNQGNLFFKANILAEERQNGTGLTHNSTGLGTASLRYERQFNDNSLSVLAYHTREGFHSSFSAVTGGRNTERLTYLQEVPSHAEGGAALWRHSHRHWNLLAGADIARADGTSTDHLLPEGLRVGGGTQLQHGVFAQADLVAGPVRLFGGARHSFAGQGNRFFSPSGGVAFTAKRLRARASVYRGFRAPTLNELFRNFSVGNTFTRANPALQPETTFGAEAGVDYSLDEGSSIRVTLYRNSLDRLITNVTLSSSASQIVRERRNAAEALSRGIEAGFRRSFGRHWNADVEYLFATSFYMTGPRVAQVPRHQATGSVTFQREGTLASFGVRSFDYQFDDDLNQFRLPGYAALQLVAHQRLHGPLSAELEIENLLDRRFYTAFTPTPNIGAPRLFRLGLRWNGGW
jgi:outer membrane receptor protein involved in Fe transport